MRTGRCRAASGRRPSPGAGRRLQLLRLGLAALVSIGLAGCAAGRADTPPVAVALTSPSAITTPLPTSPPSVSGSTRPSAAITATGRPAVSPALPSNLASRLHTLPAATRQVVIVHAGGYATTYATLETFQRTNGTWRPVFAPMPARIGEQGFTDSPAEGRPATPTGVYGFGATIYGNSPDPGVRYPYHHLNIGDYWDENSASPTYNTFVHGSDPGGASEALWQSPTAYSRFAFITYNVPAVPGRGSGIFLHQSLGKYTAGCVAVSGSALVQVLTWLDPAAAPRIVLAPDPVLARY